MPAFAFAGVTSQTNSATCVGLLTGTATCTGQQNFPDMNGNGDIGVDVILDYFGYPIRLNDQIQDNVPVSIKDQTAVQFPFINFSGNWLLVDSGKKCANSFSFSLLGVNSTSTAINSFTTILSTSTSGLDKKYAIRLSSYGFTDFMAFWNCTDTTYTSRSYHGTAIYTLNMLSTSTPITDTHFTIIAGTFLMLVCMFLVIWLFKRKI